ncbi:hypothetical protein ACS0TY_031868 [Phlomoides rotata]
MDISDNDGKEICPILKKVATSDDKDLISDLPDAILVHILSFLPIKDAINTILLRRFGNLWRSIQVLDFDSCLYHDCDDRDYVPDYLNDGFVDVIRYVLNHHDSITLDTLRLTFGFDFSYTRDESLGDGFDYYKEWEKSTAVQIEKLIRYAISKKVKVLDVNLKGCTSVQLWEIIDLPDVLSSNYLKYLRLVAFNITSCTIIDLKSLRVLLLVEVSISDDIMENVLLGCPFLEDMSLIDCYGLRKLNCKNPNLKKVMLDLTKLEYERVIISCPHVLSLEIRGMIGRADLLDVSSDVYASIYFGYFRCEKKSYDDVRRFLQKVGQCNTFSPCRWSILVLTIWTFTNVRCPTFECKNLILKVGLKIWHLPGLSLLWKNCASLETLTMYIYPSSGPTITMKEAAWIQAYEFDAEKYWDSQEAPFPCLGTVLIYGCVNEPYVLQLVKFLLRSAAGLKKLVISTKERLEFTHERLQFTSEQLQELSQKFNSLPRASPEVKVYFS